MSSTEGFEPSGAWEGARDGKVFKCGKHGQGYYVDAGGFSASSAPTGVDLSHEFVGKEVEAYGLVRRPELNGQRGTVIAYVEEKGRCAVTFNNVSGVLLKAANLKVTPRLAHTAPASRSFCSMPTPEETNAAWYKSKATSADLNKTIKQIEAEMAGRAMRSMTKAASKGRARHAHVDENEAPDGAPESQTTSKDGIPDEPITACYDY